MSDFRKVENVEYACISADGRVKFDWDAIREHAAKPTGRAMDGWEFLPKLLWEAREAGIKEATRLPP